MEHEKDFINMLLKLDDKKQKTVLVFMNFLATADRARVADYEQTYKGDSGKVCRFLEYAIYRLVKGDSATAIWNEYQQQEGGGNNGIL